MTGAELDVGRNVSILYCSFSVIFAIFIVIINLLQILTMYRAPVPGGTFHSFEPNNQNKYGVPPRST